MKELIPTDIEVFGYRNVEIDPKPTDVHKDDELNYSDHRVQVDLNKLLIINLGRGREIRIRFYANKTDIEWGRND